MSSNQHLELRNSGPFIVITDTTTGVQVRINKTNLLVQRDNGGTFFLKSDSYIAYYNYDEFSSPETDDIDHLLDVLTTWVASGSIENNSSSSSSSTFISTSKTIGRICYANPSIATLSSNASVVDESIGDLGKMSLEDDTAGSYIIRQTTPSCPFVFGGTYFSIVNGTLAGSSNTSNVVSRIGMFDDYTKAPSVGNGMFFQHLGSNFSLVYRTNRSGAQVDTVVDQADWNIDTLDGKGPSGATISATSATNFIFEWNGHGVRRAGIIDHNNVTNDIGTIFCHSFSNNVPFFGNASLPARWELYHDPSLGSDSIIGSMVQGDVVATTDVAQDPEPIIFSVADLPVTSVTSQDEVTHVASFRINPLRPRSKFRIKAVKLLNTAQGGIGKWELVSNPTLSTSATFEDVSQIDSDLQTSTDATSATDGETIASGFIVGASQDVCTDITQKWYSVYVDGSPDLLSVRVQLMGGILSLSLMVTWEEMR